MIGGKTLTKLGVALAAALALSGCYSDGYG